MKKTGILLKEARENKGLSIHEVSLTLKINSRILRAIEDADIENLPAKTFLRGFVKSYSTYLKLDSEKVLEVFHEEMGTTNPSFQKSTEAPAEPTSEEIIADKKDKEEVVSNETKESPTLSNESSFNKKGLMTFAFIFALLLIILVVKRTINKYEKESEVSTSAIEKSTEENLEPEKTQTTDNLKPAESNTLSKPETPSNQEVSPKQQNNSQQTTSAAGITSTPSAPPNSTQPKEAASLTLTPPKTPTKESTPPQTPPPTESQNTGRPVEVIIEALDGVEIEYSTLTGSPNRLSLKAEQVHTFKSKNGLVLNISNGGAVNLFVNGKEVGIPGDLGKPVKLTYSK